MENCIVFYGKTTALKSIVTILGESSVLLRVNTPLRKCWVYNRDAQIFQKSRNDLKILGATLMSRSTFHTEETKTSGTNVKYLVAAAT
jgi:hypothetical protein